MSALIRRPMRTNKGERPHPEHCETVNRFGDAEVRNFEDRWIVFCYKQVLRNRIDVREVMGDNSTETAYLGCEIAMCDAWVSMYYKRDVRVGSAHTVSRAGWSLSVPKERNRFDR